MASTATKRLMKELRDLQEDPLFVSDAVTLAKTPEAVFCVFPIQDNFFDWHFAIRGPEESDYAAGLFHGRIEFPTDYPFNPPNFQFFTPNGRFDTNIRICLSVTTFHRETWQPAWGVRTMLMAIRSHFCVEDKGAVGYVSATPAKRQQLALSSVENSCCHVCSPRPKDPSSSGVLYFGIAAFAVALAALYLLYVSQ